MEPGWFSLYLEREGDGSRRVVAEGWESNEGRGAGETHTELLS